MKKLMTLILMTSLLASFGCSEDEEETAIGSFDSGIPETTPIVAAATPSDLTTVTASSLQFFQDQVIPMSTSCTLNASSSAADILDCFQRRVFSRPASNSETGGLPDANIFKHVAEFDYRIEILENSQGDIPDCFADDPTTFDMSINAGGSNTSLIGDVYLTCREDHTVSDIPGVDFQNLAIGKNGTTWYLFLRTSYNSGESARILIAQAEEGGDTVEAWLLSYRDYDGGDDLDTPGAGDAGSDDLRVIRIMANRSDNSFFFNTATYNYNNNPFVEVWMRSDGTNLFVKSLSVSGGGSSSDRQSVIANSGCVLNSDFTASGTCTGLNTLPAGSGLGGDLAETEMNSATLLGNLKALRTLDISSLKLFTFNATPSE